MPTSAYTDRRDLKTVAYADPTALETRVSIYAHQRPKHDLAARATELLRSADGPLLDLGCGPGHYVRALRADRPERMVVAGDLSADLGITLPPHFGNVFHLDEAEETLRRHFASVKRIDFEAVVTVPDSEPVAAFLSTILPWYAPPETHGSILDRVRARAAAFRFRTHSGFLVCR